ncbi:MAG: rubredoxin, partial [Bacteroidaceae bacterium]|nr:rubredoxin [Bacteroidaceae bacterium]
MKKYRCTICKYEYDPAQGDPTQGIAPGTPFEQLPADWKCPRCKKDKSVFEPIEEPKPANPYAGTQTEKNL